MNISKANPYDKRKLGGETIEGWQNLINVAAEIFGVPAGLITRLDRSEIEIFLASKSRDNPYPADYKTRFPGSGWYCERTLSRNDLLLIPNALKDPEWKDNAAAAGQHMISYAGLPITRPDGGLFGTICFLDNKENSHNDLHIRLLRQIGKMIELSLLAVFDRDEIAGRDSLFRDLSRIYPICAYCKKVREKTGGWIRIEKYVENISGRIPSHGICPECIRKEEQKRRG